MRIGRVFGSTMATVMLASSIAVAAASAAPAETDGEVTVGEAAAALADVADVTGPSAKTVASPEGFTAEAAGSVVELPKDPIDGLSLTASSGVSIEVGLPGATTADDGVRQPSGQVVYADAMPDVAVSAQATPDGGLRALVVIDGPQAPTEFRFPMTVPDGAVLVPSPDGGAAVVAADGAVVVSVAAPWAYDATGRQVRTSYRIDGTSLVQSVDHVGATYPVVADPSIGFGWNIYLRLAPWEQKAVINAGIAGIATTVGGLLCTASVVGGPAAVAVCAGAVVAAGVLIYEVVNRYYNPKCWVELKFSYGLSFKGVGDTCWRRV